MVQIKMCGLTGEEDIAAANAVRPEYIGFVFAEKSKRYVPPEEALRLRRMLREDIRAVGVFVDEPMESVAALLLSGTIDLAQLHGNESDAYIQALQAMTAKPVIKAFRIGTQEDVLPAQQSAADLILLDAGAGDGRMFDWSLIQAVRRPYYLAGGLSPENVGEAVRVLHPFGVDVSSGIETNGRKDKHKMAAFWAAVRKEERK